MRIKILAVEVKEVKEGKKDYKILDVSYKNLDFNGKVEGKKIVSFASPDVFNALKGSNPGDEFDVTKGEKSAAGFVPWTRCVTASGENTVLEDNRSGVSGQSQAVSGTTKGTPRSTYETPEERAKKQVYIVRQSSISNAIAFLDGDSDPAIKDVIDTAKQFEAYVFGTDPMTEIMEMENDIPL